MTMSVYKEDKLSSPKQFNEETLKDMTSLKKKSIEDELKIFGKL